MPAPLVDFSGVVLDEAALRYLDAKSPSTRKAYEKCLKRFTLYSGAPLRDFLVSLEAEMKANLDRPIDEKTRPGETAMRGFIQWHVEAGYSNYSILQALGAVQNFAKFYGVPISFEFIDTPPARPMKMNEKHEWTLDQIRQFVEAAEYLRDKAYIMVAFQSGLSIGDVLALDYGDISREYEAGTLPLSIQGYREKTNVPIRTFVGADAVGLLRLYLQSRPDLGPGDPIFTKLGSPERATPVSIQRKLRQYAAKLDFIYDEDLEEGYNPARPHSLRSAFRSRLTGKMDGQLIEFLMAHDIGQERSTYINMPLDELREIYASYEHLLSIESTSRDVKAGPSKISEKALNELSRRVAELTRENATIKAEMESVTAALRAEIEELRPAGRQLEVLEALTRLDPEVRRLVESLAERIREAA